MKFEMVDHLPLVAVEIEYNGNKKSFGNVLLDTGSSSTILDTDLCEEVGLMLDLENAITRKMYGIGGTEICIEQINDLNELLNYSGAIRIVKGAYQEPLDISIPRSDKLDQRYLELVDLCVKAGHQVSIASHDEAIYKQKSSSVVICTI